MNFILTCERCGEKFTEESRAPVILPDCGHTFCEYCIADLLSEFDKFCPQCNTEIKTTDPSKYIKNHKILALLKMDQPEAMGDPDNYVYCPRHLDKVIEYFCKQCSNTVCVKCMFDEHNGHDLVQIEEMASSLKQNVLDLQKMLVNAHRLNEENQKLIEQVKEELNRLKFQQMKNIDKGFYELQKKLEDKKTEIKFEFEKRYKKEEQKFMTKMSLINSNLEEIKNIERIFEELLQFIDNNIDSKILQKANDVTTFLHKSFTDLDIITKNQIAQKSEIYIHPSFKPLTLNVKKAIEIVNKFEMIPPSGAAGASSAKVQRSPQAKGLIGGGGATNGYSSGNEGSQIGGIEVDPFTGIPYYDPTKNSKSGNANGGGRGNNLPSGSQPQNSAVRNSGGSAMAPHRRPGGAGSLGERGAGSSGSEHIFSSVICYGDYEEILRYNLESQRWEKVRYESGSSLNGNLRYSGSAYTPDGRIIITGGCLISTGDATSTTFECNIQKPGKFTRKKMMTNRRYAHASTSLNGYVYVLGGFDNKDADGVAPSTLDSVERYSIHENRWIQNCSMNDSRAFCGCVTIGDQFIYLVGGFQDYTVLNTIEKYDSVLDNWTTLLVKLPQGLAKMGVCATDGQRQMAIVGGMNPQFHPQKAMYLLDMKTMKFSSCAEMKTAKTFNSNVHFHEGSIYTFGGNDRDACEKYDTYQNKWEMLPSYAEVVSSKGTNELNGWTQLNCPITPSLIPL